MDAVSKTSSQAPETSMPSVELEHPGQQWVVSGQQPAGEIRTGPGLEEEWQDCQKGLTEADMEGKIALHEKGPLPLPEVSRRVLTSNKRGTFLKMNGTVSPSSLVISRNLSASCSLQFQHISITVIPALLCLGGAVLNSFSLWVFWFRVKNWSSGTFLQFHLGLSDTIIIPITPLMATYFAMGNSWPFGQFLCQLKISLLIVHVYGSIMFLTLISVHRYTAVVRHKSSSAMKRVGFIRKVCAAVWLLLLALGMSSFVLLGTSQVGNRTQCLSIHQGEFTEAYFVINFILLVLGFLVPFCVAVACYCRLACSVSRINASSAKGQAIKARSLKMVAVCLLIFGLCFLPLNVARTMAVVIKKYYPDQCSLLLKVETAYYVAWILACANCCFDPLLYCFGSPDFNRAVRCSLKKFGIKSQEACPKNEQDSQDLPTRTAQSTNFLDKETASNSSI